MLNHNQKKILQTLDNLGKPAGGKDISAASGFDEKMIAKELAKLKTQGFIESPVRCKYCVSSEGKKHI